MNNYIKQILAGETTPKLIATKIIKEGRGSEALAAVCNMARRQGIDIDPILEHWTASKEGVIEGWIVALCEKEQFQNFSKNEVNNTAPVIGIEKRLLAIEATLDFILKNLEDHGLLEDDENDNY